MSSYKECPSCRALLTAGQLAANPGVCPYCGTKLAPAPKGPQEFDSDLDNRYAPPLSPIESRGGHTVPASFGGKMVMAFRMLFAQLPLFAALVWTVWIPGHVLIDSALAGNPNPGDRQTMLFMGVLVDIVFGPIYIAAILTALAAWMGGERVSYIDALRAGLHHWGRLFAAKLLAMISVFLGVLAFIVPGIVLAVRFMLIDEVVVLEGSGAWESRQRSSELTWGKGLQIFRGWLVSVAMIMGLSLVLAAVVQGVGLDHQALAADVCDCLISVFSVFPICLFFLFYWEARQREADRGLAPDV